MGLLFADKVADRRIHAHDLESRNFRAVERRHELLAYHCLQDHRKLHADLALLVRRERIEDTVDRVRAARSVQRREDELCHLGCRDRRADRVVVAHLAQEHDIGRFAHCRTKRF